LCLLPLGFPAWNRVHGETYTRFNSNYNHSFDNTNVNVSTTPQRMDAVYLPEGK
jgi:hypothetical protein